jgi:hypothetical protein
MIERRRAAPWIVVALAAALASCGTPPRRQPEMSQDPLEKRLADAVQKGLAPDAVEAWVGQPALINTRRPGDRGALQMADIQPDPSFQATLPRLADAQDVVYWKLAETPRDVVVVGIYWLPERPGVVFKGLIGPP